MSRRRGLSATTMTYRPVVPGSIAHLASMGLPPLGRVLYPDLHHRRVVAQIAAVRAKLPQTAEHPQPGRAEGVHHFKTRSGGPSGCNTECA